MQSAKNASNTPRTCSIPSLARRGQSRDEKAIGAVMRRRQKNSGAATAPRRKLRPINGPRAMRTEKRVNPIGALLPQKRAYDIDQPAARPHQTRGDFEQTCLNRDKLPQSRRGEAPSRL